MFHEDAAPRAGVDYPRTFHELDAWFSSDEACRSYLRRLRWPEGFSCPRCERPGVPWSTARGYLHCRHCGGEVALTAGTIFESTRKPLRTWFLAMWFVTSQKHGASALGLQRVLGFGSYETAWTWLHKLRRAMVRPGRDRLSGTVEVDETYIGGRQEGARGRQTESKAVVGIAAQVRSRGAIGRIRLARVADAAASSLLPFVQESVVPGALVRTDGWGAYANLVDGGFRHEAVVISKSGLSAHEVFPRVHRVASLLKRWLLGIHQGGVQHRHLDYYLDEFTFRFNRRASGSRGLLFFRLLQQAVALGPTPYRQIVGGRELPAKPASDLLA